MGVPGCDNKITYVAHNSGMIVRNPSYTIKAIHVHANEWRDDERNKAQIKGPYKWVIPTTLRR